MSECGFAWTDDTKTAHVCARRGGHNVHIARDGASRVRPSISDRDAWGSRRIGTSVYHEADVPTTDEVA